VIRSSEVQTEGEALQAADISPTIREVERRTRRLKALHPKVDSLGGDATIGQLRHGVPRRVPDGDVSAKTAFGVRTTTYQSP
jgi:hypothetical protein